MSEKNRKLKSEHQNRVQKLLSSSYPFYFLDNNCRKYLAENLSYIVCTEGQKIFSKSERDDRVFLVREGLVEIFTTRRGHVERIDVITKRQYFGERAVLFSQPRFASARALIDSEIYYMEGNVFLELLHSSRNFAQAMGNILRDNQGIFVPFDKFVAEVVRDINRGRLEFSRLIMLYKELEPAIHCKVNSKNSIDFHGLSYAVRRLPENLTAVFAYFLTDEVPHVLNNALDLLNSIPSAGRRRTVYEMLPGQNLVLLRSGSSDLLDLITCLCLYAVEVKKIRYRLNDGSYLRMIDNFLLDQTGPAEDPVQRLKEEEKVLQRMNFTENEVLSLRQIWPNDTLNKLYQILLHRENFSIRVRRQRDNYSSRSTESWTSMVGKACYDFLGFEPSQLPENIRVHIISSNTHSVMNCLNPYFNNHAKEIFKWAADFSVDYDKKSWHRAYDFLYSIFPEYSKACPEETTGFYNNEGFYFLHDTVTTGIQVQLVDLSHLSEYELDPGIPSIAKHNRDIIVNIDYAFGEQAGEIIRNLLMLFGKNLGSINILGKAGALLGDRGDILVPTAFIEQLNDSFQPLKNSALSNIDEIKKNYGDLRFHSGSMLTVSGTLLQNQKMLKFYRNIWNCIGLEMEGFHYQRFIQKAAQLGVMNEETPIRYFYYVSDLPLSQKDSLAAPMSSLEGVPPLYCITREILKGIIESGNNSGQ